MEENIRTCLPQHLGILLHSSTTGGDDRDMFPNESIIYTTEELGNRYLFHVAVMLMQGLRAWKAHCDLLDLI
jgi:hypothetical protein